MKRQLAVLAVVGLFSAFPPILNAQARGSRGGAVPMRAPQARPVQRLPGLRPSVIVRGLRPFVSPFYRNSLFYTPGYAPTFFDPQPYTSSAPAVEVRTAPASNSDEMAQLTDQIERLTEEVGQLRAQQLPPQEPEPRTLLPTVLAFRDGHHIEIQSYAIVGDTLFDLAQPGSGRISIADLDLQNTQKLNAERGVRFLLPVKH